MCSNDNLAFGYTGSEDREAQQKIVDRLTNAESVDVRYDEANPETSALSFGFHRALRMKLCFSAVWMTFVIGMTVFTFLWATKERMILDNIVTRP
jgi:hypothetical protein